MAGQERNGNWQCQIEPSGMRAYFWGMAWANKAELKPVSDTVNQITISALVRTSSSEFNFIVFFADLARLNSTAINAAMAATPKPYTQNKSISSESSPILNSEGSQPQVNQFNMLENINFKG